MRQKLPDSFLHAICLIFLLLLSACATPTSQNSQPDPRLKSFHVLSQRITILDTQAQVDGMVQNNGHDQYPYDVTLDATFYDTSGKVIGHAQGVAEDIWPSMTRSFTLLGDVDSTKYSRMAVVPTSLRERRNEKNLPSPPPVVP